MQHALLAVLAMQYRKNQGGIYTYMSLGCFCTKSGSLIVREREMNVAAVSMKQLLCLQCTAIYGWEKNHVWNGIDRALRLGKTFFVTLLFSYLREVIIDSCGYGVLRLASIAT